MNDAKLVIQLSGQLSDHRIALLIIELVELFKKKTNRGREIIAVVKLPFQGARVESIKSQ